MIRWLLPVAAAATLASCGSDDNGYNDQPSTKKVDHARRQTENGNCAKSDSGERVCVIAVDGTAGVPDPEDFLLRNCNYPGSSSTAITVSGTTRAIVVFC